MTSNRGNEISKTGTESDPAVHIERSGNDVVKKASELTVEEKGETNGTSEKKETNGTSSEKKEDEAPKAEEKKEAVVEDKEAEEPKEGEKKAETKEEKPAATNGDAKVGEKRKADDAAPEEDTKEDGEVKEPELKKVKTADAEAEKNDKPVEKKKPGRPKGAASKAKEKKEPRRGQSLRKTRSQVCVLFCSRGNDADLWYGRIRSEFALILMGARYGNGKMGRR